MDMSAVYGLACPSIRLVGWLSIANLAASEQNMSRPRASDDRQLRIQAGAAGQAVISGGVSYSLQQTRVQRIVVGQYQEPIENLKLRPVRQFPTSLQAWVT